MANEEKLEWIYKGANSLVDREEYLLGRSVDKALEQKNEEEKEKKFVLPTPKNHVEHECIPPSIRDFNKIVQAEQVDLSTKLQEDPLVAIRKREEEARRKFLQNPVQLKKLQEALQAQQKKKQKKSKKKRLESDLDSKIMEKLRLLKGDTPATATLGNKKKENSLDTILMHKFNALKDKLSEEDLNDILNGKISSDEEEPKRKKYRSRSVSGSESEDKKKWNRKKKVSSNGNNKSRHQERKQSKYSDSSDDDVKKKQNKRKSAEADKRKSKSKLDYQDRRRRNPKRKSSSTESSDSDSEADYKKRNKEKSDKTTVKRFDSKGETKHKEVKSRSKVRSSAKLDENKLPALKEGPKKNDLDTLIMEKLKILRCETEKKTSYPEKPKHLKRESTSSSSESTSSDTDSDSDDNKLKKSKAFGLVTSEGKKIKLKHNAPQKIETKALKKSDIPSKATHHERQAKKLTEEEKERLRREMMTNAKIRDKEREANVKRYSEKDRKEAETVSKKYDKDFIHTALVKTAKISSVEDRIKSNINNIQRSSSHMNLNFSKR